MDFARRIKELGYKVSINPINIMGYSDKDLLWIFEQVNEIHPWQFSIVDTFGSMRRRDLERIVSMADHNLAPDIRLALHLHENMALSFCLAQEFLDKHLRRDLAVDGSLMGMGRIPGNLPIELIADYMNEYFGGHYNIDDLMDAIQDHIAPIKGNCAWGYTPAYFLSAKFNLHRNYAEHYLGKGDLTNRDINHILAAIAPNKRLCLMPPTPTRSTPSTRTAASTTQAHWPPCRGPLRARPCWCWPRRQPGCRGWPCRCSSRAGRRDSLGQLCAGFCDARLCVFHERKTI